MPENPTASDGCAQLLANVLKQAQAGIKFPVHEATGVIQSLKKCLDSGRITQAQYNLALQEIKQDNSRV